MPHVVSESVKSILRSAEAQDDRIVITAKLDRPAYIEVNKTLEVLGGKWNKQAKAHLFPKRDAKARIAEALGGAVEATKIADPKKDFEFFETPESIAASMVSLAGIKTGMKFLEPSAGGGRICEAIVSLGIPKKSIHVCELQDSYRRKLLRSGYNVIGSNFLDVKPPQRDEWKYDRVLMNPPFSNGQDVDHLVHAMRFVKTFGVVIAITSPSWTFNTQKKFVAFRTWFQFEQSAGRATMETLPAGTFKESGTDIRSLMLRIESQVLAINENWLPRGDE